MSFKQYSVMVVFIITIFTHIVQVDANQKENATSTVTISANNDAILSQSFQSEKNNTIQIPSWLSMIIGSFIAALFGFIASMMSRKLDQLDKNKSLVLALKSEIKVNMAVAEFNKAILESETNELLNSGSASLTPHRALHTNVIDIIASQMPNIKLKLDTSEVFYEYFMSVHAANRAVQAKSRALFAVSYGSNFGSIMIGLRDMLLIDTNSFLKTANTLASNMGMNIENDEIDAQS